jgi:class 3 adenylate cyclase/predicted ATPase
VVLGAAGGWPAGDKLGRWHVSESQNIAIADWLAQEGLSKYRSAFAESGIGFDILPDLTEADLATMGIALGDRKRLLRAIAGLRRTTSSSSDAGQAGAQAPAAQAQESWRRHLTVLFCDLVGSTAMSQRLDPEDVSDVIRDFQDTCIGTIVRSSGYVARLMGDGILAYFGFPQATEHDAQSAVRVGLEMVAKMAWLRTPEGEQLHVRIGIATGLVVVVGETSIVGAPREMSVVGTTPNLASRLQNLAEADTVLISDSTRELLGEMFDCEDGGLHEIKGLDDPVRVWRVLDERRNESRFDATRSHNLAQLIGRTSELAQLSELWQKARKGVGQVALLSGEAGIGKSRLCRALLDETKDDPHHSIRYQCSPHHTQSPLHPIIAQLERAANFEREDDPDVRLAKLARLLNDGGGKGGLSIPLFAALLSIPAEHRYTRPALSPAILRKQTIEALVDRILALAASKPVLLVMEDLHWIDPTTLEFLGLCLDKSKNAPVLALLTFRPEFEPPWTPGPNVSAIGVHRLKDEEVIALIDGVTAGRKLPSNVYEQIIRRTDGVPLFVEELTRAVVESDGPSEDRDPTARSASLPSFVIPATLQETLTARLDRVPSAREVAQVAAALGREFSFQLLSEVTQLPSEQLSATLALLADIDMIHGGRGTPEGHYVFKHALVQGVAYETMLRAKRRPLHARIAEVVQQSFQDIAATQPELVAHHLTEAQLPAQAVEWWRRAGERNVQASANAEAIDHFLKALQLIRTVPETVERLQQELALEIALGGALIATRGLATHDVVEVFARARELSERVGAGTEFFRVLWGQWLNCSSRAEYQTARDLAQQCLSVAERASDPVLLVQAHYAVGAGCCASGRFAEAVTHLDQALAGYDHERRTTSANTFGQDPGVGSLIFTGYALWFLGYPEQAQKKIEEGLVLAQKLAHPPTSATAAAFGALVQQLCRNIRAVEALAGQAIDLSTRHGLPYMRAMGSILAGWAMTQGDRIDPGIAQMSPGIEALRATGAVALIGHFSCLLAEGHAAAGKPEEGLRVLMGADPSRALALSSELARLRGELLLQAANGSREAQDQAEPCFLEALRISREQKAKSMELRAALSLGRLRIRQGRRTDAKAALSGIFNSFTEGFDTPDLRDALKLLRELEE